MPPKGSKKGKKGYSNSAFALGRISKRPAVEVRSILKRPGGPPPLRSEDDDSEDVDIVDVLKRPAGRPLGRRGVDVIEDDDDRFHKLDGEDDAVMVGRKNL